MTLETAKRIKEEGTVPEQEAKTYDQYMLLNKEAEAILRGGMTKAKFERFVEIMDKIVDE